MTDTERLAIMREALLAIRDNPGVCEGAKDPNLWPDRIASQALADCEGNNQGGGQNVRSSEGNAERGCHE